MRALRHLAAWLAAFVLCVWRLTCRARFVDDPRPRLRREGRGYAMALLHAHQIGAVIINDEAAMAAMVSRSADGDLLVPSLRLRRVRAVRGSTHKGGKDKGGRAALAELMRVVAQRIPALIAVDGPRGPRNHVHRGVADLAISCDAVIVPVIVIPSRRWILSGTWDRMQIPQPFCRIDTIFKEPIVPLPGETPEHLRDRVAAALAELEATHDPTEHGLMLARASATGELAQRASP